MSGSREIKSETLCQRMTGFTVEEIFSPKFVGELKNALPTAVIGHIAISIPDSKEFVYVGHDIRTSKLNLNWVDVEGNDPKMVDSVVAAIRKALS